MIRLAAVFALSACLASACASERAPDDCKLVCQREGKCRDEAATRPAPEAAENDQNRFDQTECVAACTALLRDSGGEGQKLVAAHKTCVEAAGASCAALLKCE